MLLRSNVVKRFWWKIGEIVRYLPDKKHVAQLSLKKPAQRAASRQTSQF